MVRFNRSGARHAGNLADGALQHQVKVSMGRLISIDIDVMMMTLQQRAKHATAKHADNRDGALALLYIIRVVRGSRCQSRRMPARRMPAGFSLSLTMGDCWQSIDLAANHSTFRRVKRQSVRVWIGIK